MAFRGANLARLAKFNSAASSEFIDFYESAVDASIASRNDKPKHRTFAPSAFRCDRLSWFRLRGVQPDTAPTPDRALEFTAQIGTACHAMIQKTLQEALGDDWIDVETYMKSANLPYSFKCEKDGYETKIEIENPPVRFACDGIIRWKGELYLLEIKTSEYSSFDELMNPKPQHEDQIKFYATTLGLSKVLVLYMDRQYGGLKCYEVVITENDRQYVQEKIANVIRCVEANIAPDRLPRDDSWCTAGHCPYFKKCREWG